MGGGSGAVFLMTTLVPYMKTVIQKLKTNEFCVCAGACVHVCVCVRVRACMCVCAGNGPSAITLSFLLHGYRPYYNGNTHSNTLLTSKLQDSKSSLVEQVRIADCLFALSDLHIYHIYHLLLK